MAKKVPNVPQNHNNHGFSPRMDLLLFEEPEVSLHPEAIKDLVYDLRKFATDKHQQVLATTHSSLLLSEDVADINSVIRVEKSGKRTVIHQSGLPETDLNAIRNLVYFDRPRSDMFFSKKVVLVEGHIRAENGVTALHARELISEVECRRARGQRDGVFASDFVGDGGLDRAEVCTLGGHPIGLVRLGDVFHFIAVHRRRGEPDFT